MILFPMSFYKIEKIWEEKLRNLETDTENTYVLIVRTVLKLKFWF